MVRGVKQSLDYRAHMEFHQGYLLDLHVTMLEESEELSEEE